MFKTCGGFVLVKVYKIILLLSVITSSLGQAANVCRDQGMKHGLFSIKTDGSNLRLVRLLQYPAGYPEINYDKLHVSSDGKKLVYLRCLKDLKDTCQCDSYIGAKEIVVSDIDGSKEIVISKDEGGFNDYPNWSPDNNALLFMFSTKGKGADLFTYDLRTQSKTQITNTQLVQESDNFWNTNNKFTVVVKDYSQEGKSNFITSFDINDTTQQTKLTDPRSDSIRHCCYADPKFSYDQKYLVYSKFEKENGAEGDWDIMLRSTKDNSEVDLSQNEFMDLYPLFSRDNKKIFWTRYDHVRKVTSYVFFDIATGKQSSVDIFGSGVKHHIDGRQILFGSVKWADWYHPNNDTIMFPATFLFKD
jgi:Tol biopolymer transport system component